MNFEINEEEKRIVLINESSITDILGLKERLSKIYPDIDAWMISMKKKEISMSYDAPKEPEFEITNITNHKTEEDGN